MVSSAAPQNAATEPVGGQPDRPAVPRGAAVGRRGIFEGQQRQQQRHDGDAGHDPEQWPPGMERRLGAADQRARRHGPEDAHVHDHRCPAQLGGRVAKEQRRRGRDQQQAGAQALQHVPGDEHRRAGRRRGQYRSSHQQGGVDEHHPALGQVLGELDGQHRADRVAGIGQAPGQAQLLRAQVQRPADQRCERPQRRRQHQVGHQEQDHHRRHRGVAAGQRSRPPRPRLGAAELLGFAGGGQRRR